MFGIISDLQTQYTAYKDWNSGTHTFTYRFPYLSEKIYAYIICCELLSERCISNETESDV